MGLFDIFFKKKAPQEPELKKILFADLNNFLREEKDYIKEEKSNFNDLVNNNIKELVKDLSEKSKVLETIDLHDKKTPERAKTIVLENLKNYHNYLEKLIDKLKDFNATSEKDIIKSINNIFTEFEKRSKISYEKATFLIGKELGTIRGSIAGFFTELKKTIEANKNFIERTKKITIIDNTNNEITKIDRIINEINRNNIEINKKIDELKESIDKENISIKKIKESENYKESEKLYDEIRNQKNSLENVINDLKKLIDFKELSNMFHIIPRDMQTIKKYKKDFKKCILENKNHEFKELLNKNEKAKEKLTTIEKVLDKIDEDKKKINKNPYNEIDEINEKIKKLDDKINEYNEEIDKDNKKLEKFSQSKNDIIKEIRKLLLEIDVVLDTNNSE